MYSFLDMYAQYLAKYWDNPTIKPQLWTPCSAVRTMTGPSALLQACKPLNSPLWSHCVKHQNGPKQVQSKQGNLENGSTLVCFTYLTIMRYTPRREDEKSWLNFLKSSKIFCILVIKEITAKETKWPSLVISDSILLPIFSADDFRIIQLLWVEEEAWSL